MRKDRMLEQVQANELEKMSESDVTGGGPNMALARHQLVQEAEEKAHQPKVLIAEDDDSNYQVLELMMRKMTNAITLRASNGKEAVDKFSNETDIDLILMDLKMPVMDGFEATRLIRKMNAGIPIIAITAFAMSGDERRAIEAGCNDYLAKPVTMKVLLNKLAEFGLKKTN